MDSDTNGRPVSRRKLLRGAAAATGGLVAASAFAGQAAARERDCEGCLKVCWVDVKPSSCPNSVNPNSGGVLPVIAGWPNFDVSTVELVPVKGEFDAAFGRCQNWEAPAYSDGAETAKELCELAGSSGRSASPVWWRREDVDGDGDLDSKFRFRVSDLELESDDTYLVLGGESTSGECAYYGTDSVRVVGGDGARTGGPHAGRE